MASSQNLGMKVVWPPSGNDSFDSDIVADIIFVHGLWGSRETTWTDNGQLWPEKLLAKDFEKARIITYGYHANPVAFFDSRSEGTITTLARSLIQDLKAIRRGRTDQEDRELQVRPIIFIAHSLGGLLVKDALYRCHISEGKARESWDYAQRTQNIIEKERAENYDSEVALKEAAEAGALFFVGTPHHGSNKANMVKMLIGFETIYGSHKGLVSSLKIGAEVLDRLQEEFRGIMDRFNIYSFREEIQYKKCGLIVETASATVGSKHEILINVPANHVEMVRFSDPTDYRYTQIKDQLKDVFRRLARRRTSLYARNVSMEPSRHRSPGELSVPSTRTRSAGGNTNSSLLTFYPQQSPATPRNASLLSSEEYQSGVNEGNQLQANTSSPKLWSSDGSDTIKSDKTLELEAVLRDAEQYLDRIMPGEAQDKLNEARNLLGLIGSSNDDTLSRIFRGLATSQVQKTWKKGLPRQDYVRYLERAQHYANKSLDLSRPNTGFGNGERTCSELEDVKQRCEDLQIEYPVPSYKV